MGKYLVYMINDFTLLKREYFGKGEGVVIGYHDPRKATLFDTREEAKEFADTFNMVTKIGEASKHFNLMDKADYVYRSLPLLQPDLNKMYNGEGKSEVIDWWMRVRKSASGTVSSKTYSSWPNLYEVCDHLWSACSYYSTDKPRKLHYTFEIYTQRKSTFDSFKKEFTKIIDCVDYLDKDGYKMLPIFDHELSQYEKRYFYYKDEKDCKIGSRYNMVSGSLKKCFETMRTHYYYDR